MCEKRLKPESYAVILGVMLGAVAACRSIALVSSAENILVRRLRLRCPAATSAISIAAAVVSSGASKSANPSYSAPGV